MEFDQSLSWRGLEDKLARTTNGRHRMMIQTVIDHAKAETVGDVDGLMATLSDDPQSHFWSGGGDWGHPPAYTAMLDAIGVGSVRS